MAGEKERIIPITTHEARMILLSVMIGALVAPVIISLSSYQS